MGRLDLQQRRTRRSAHPKVSHLSRTHENEALLTATDAILARLKVQPDDNAATKKTKAALAAQFIAHELPEDFIQNLRSCNKSKTDGVSVIGSAGSCDGLS